MWYNLKQIRQIQQSTGTNHGREENIFDPRELRLRRLRFSSVRAATVSRGLLSIKTAVIRIKSREARSIYSADAPRIIKENKNHQLKTLDAKDRVCPQRASPARSSLKKQNQPKTQQESNLVSQGDLGGCITDSQRNFLLCTRTQVDLGYT